LIHKEFI